MNKSFVWDPTEIALELFFSACTFYKIIFSLYLYFNICSFTCICKYIEPTCRDRASSFTLLRLFISSEKRVSVIHQTVFSILWITRKGIPFDMSDISKRKLFNPKAPEVCLVVKKMNFF